MIAAKPKQTDNTGKPGMPPLGSSTVSESLPREAHLDHPCKLQKALT
jgi:hypothetical protein